MTTSLHLTLAQCLHRRQNECNFSRCPYVGVDLTLLEEDSKRTRGPRPYVMARRRQNHGVTEVVAWLEREGGLTLRPKT